MRHFLSAGSLRASLESAWTVRRSSGAQDVFLGYGGTATGAGAGFVYRETGTTIPAQDDRLQWSTRRMYLAGEGSEWKLAEMYGQTDDYATAASVPNVTYTLSTTKTNDSGPITGPSKTLSLTGSRLHKVVFNAMSEGVIVTAFVTASSYAQHNLILDGEGWGDEDSGR
jgi:hypothetical protein